MPSSYDTILNCIEYTKCDCLYGLHRCTRFSPIGKSGANYKKYNVVL